MPISINLVERIPSTQRVLQKDNLKCSGGWITETVTKILENYVMYKLK